MRRTLAVAIALGTFLAGAASAAPLDRRDAPEPLRPWVDWTLRGHEQALCPFLQGGAEGACAWPGPLTLAVADSGAAFEQRWTLYAESWVPLPGDPAAWPQEVSANGAPAPVLAREGRPALRLPAGAHAVRGRLQWTARPAVLAVPPETGLLRLTADGAAVPFPRRDESGRLWLGEQARPETEEATQEIAVHRRVVDEVPMRVETRVELKVSGRGRELLLGRALLEGFTPMSLDSPVPARLEPDGRLRVQVRPGVWTIALLARGPGAPVAALALPEPGGPWDAEEVWSFEARPSLRLADVGGVPAVDPGQTMMPEAWRSLPAYLVEPGGTMTFEERRRGDADPAPDQLSLDRVWWLDFDGGGYTVHDAITGVVRRSSRLEMGAPGALGRASIGGQDQFITRLAEGGPLGVEVRAADIRLEADSRVEGPVGATPAVGWRQDFRELSGTLHLPPGWRLFTAWGVDFASPTWVTDWTLLDLFLALMIAAAATQLWGRKAGLLAAATLALTWTEVGAPQWAWISLFAAEALVRALGQDALRERFPGIERGRFAQGARLFRILALASLAILCVPFMIQQMRVGLYPALEYPYVEMPSDASTYAPAPAAPAESEVEAGAEMDEAMQLRDKAAQAPSKEYRRESSAGGRMLDRMAQMFAPDPNARVQTGPGLPAWSWNQVALRWNGSVEADQEIRFLYLSPAANLLLATLRTALLAALLALVFGLRGGRWRELAPRAGPAAPAAAALLLALAAPASARAEAFPPKELLDELRGRLLEKPECAPACAEAPRLAVEASPAALRARLRVDVQAATAVPLPGDLREWTPETVLVDGEPASGLLRTADGRLWLPLAPGVHEVLLEGALPKRDVVRVPLPLRPRRTEARAEGWTVEGVRADGRTGDSLQLGRISEEKEEGAALEPGTLPPFLSVEREVELGLTWSVSTRVRRLTPLGSPVVVEVPLLEGESVVTPGLETREGRALLTLGPQASEAAWRSVLKETPRIELAAADSAAYVESWRVDAAPIWHVEPSGVPWIHQDGGQGPGLREWRPWPGERVTLAITRPEGAGGPTLTADGAELTVTPGIRTTDCALALALRSSQGGKHALTLPEGAALEAVRIDGRDQPVRAEGRTVTVPIVPGAQRVQVSWRQPGGVSALFRTPEVDMGLGAVNATVTVTMPVNRWTLFLRGPRMGPAVLFWSFLAVVALACWALGRASFTPLRARHWLLLSLGLTQVGAPAAAAFAGWALALGWRGEHPPEGRGGFNLAQIGLAIWTLAAALILFGGVRQGLLGLPEMQITGNRSDATLLRWYLDRTDATPPTATIFSAPLWVYRLAMLAWALWLARAAVAWSRWAWGCFTAGGLWRPAPPRGPSPPRPPRPARPGPEGVAVPE